MNSITTLASPAPPRRRFAYVLFALLALLMIAIPTYHFSGRAYRQDEAWTAHAAIEKSLQGTVLWFAQDIHPPLWLMTVDLWIGAFGHVEPIGRFQSTLYTLLGLALLYRLARDLFDMWLALAAVFFFGTFSAIMFYGYEFRPYALLLTMTIGMQWAFLRWLRCPTFRTALLFVAFGTGGLYTHFAAVYPLAALFLFFLVFVRPSRTTCARGIGLFAAIGLSFLGWLLPFVHAIRVLRPQGIDYGIDTTSQSALRILYTQLQVRPDALGQLLLLIAILLPVGVYLQQTQTTLTHRAPLRFDPDWRRWYPIFVLATMLGLAFAVNGIWASVTPRNLVILLPCAALGLAYGLRALPWQAQIGIVLLVAYPALTSFRAYVSNGLYAEMVTFMSADYRKGDPIVVNADVGWQHIALRYFLRERLPVRVGGDALFHLIPPQTASFNATVPDPFAQRAEDDSAPALRRFADFLDQHERVWYTEVGAVNFGEPFLALLREQYVSRQMGVWGREDTGYQQHVVIEYRRIPDDLRDLFVFGDSIVMRAWTLKNDVNVQLCQSVTLESWWSARVPLPDDYSMTLVLADSSGQGIARSDGALAESQTQLWQPDAPYLDECTLTIPCDLPAGEYPLMLGVYDPDDSTGLPVTSGDGVPQEAPVYLTTLKVK